MTVHGNPGASLQNAFKRAAARAIHKKSINRFRANQHKHIRDPETYQETVEFNKNHGIVPVKRREGIEAILPMYKVSKRSVTLAHDVQPAIIDEYEEAEKRMRERAQKAVEMLCFGIEDLANVEVQRQRTPYQNASVNANKQGNMTYMVETIHRLCSYARIPVPEFSCLRKPGAQSTRVCIDCGTRLSPDDSGDQCPDCRPDTSALKALSEERREREREQEQAKRETKRLAKLLREMKKGIR